MSMRAFALLCLLALVLGGCKDDKKLKVTGVDPNVGELEGGNVVSIQGNRFTADGARNVKVYFGKAGNWKPADFLSYNGDSEMDVRAPAGEKDGDKVDILIVFEPGGEITLSQAYQYHSTKKVDVQDLDIDQKK
jgi:hypothetical protein